MGRPKGYVEPPGGAAAAPKLDLTQMFSGAAAAGLMPGGGLPGSGPMPNMPGGQIAPLPGNTYMSPLPGQIATSHACITHPSSEPLHSTTIAFAVLACLDTCTFCVSFLGNLCVLYRVLCNFLCCMVSGGCCVAPAQLQDVFVQRSMSGSKCHGLVAVGDSGGVCRATQACSSCCSLQAANAEPAPDSHQHLGRPGTAGGRTAGFCVCACCRNTCC